APRSAARRATRGAADSWRRAAAGPTARAPARGARQALAGRERTSGDTARALRRAPRPRGKPMWTTPPSAQEARIPRTSPQGAQTARRPSATIAPDRPAARPCLSYGSPTTRRLLSDDHCGHPHLRLPNPPQTRPAGRFPRSGRTVAVRETGAEYTPPKRTR